MTWNYRIVRIPNPDPKETVYAIHEAYYHVDGVCYAITQDEVGPLGYNPQELRDCWAMMAEAFTKPVLDYETRQEIEPTPFPFPRPRRRPAP